jgi:hypothetical protein
MGHFRAQDLSLKRLGLPEAAIGIIVAAKAGASLTGRASAVKASAVRMMMLIIVLRKKKASPRILFPLLDPSGASRGDSKSRMGKARKLSQDYVSYPSYLAPSSR